MTIGQTKEFIVLKTSLRNENEFQVLKSLTITNSESIFAERKVLFSPSFTDDENFCGAPNFFHRYTEKRACHSNNSF